MAGNPMGGGQPKQAGGGQNPYRQASSAYGGALNTTGAAMNMADQMPTMTAGTQQANAQGYNAAAAGTQQANAQGYDPASANAQGYTAFTGMGASGNPMAGFGAGNATGYGYTAEEMERARDVNAGQFAGMNIDPYMNPYTNQVVDRTQADMERARQIQQNQANDAMMQAGAFGGSRHGIANAETNRNFYDRLGATTGNLRNQGYQNAQQAAFQDIGNTMQADLANQGADLTTNQYNAEAVNTARRTGANNKTQASITNAGLETQLAGQRMGAVNNASQFGAAAQNRAALTNAAAQNTAGQFGAAAQNNASQFNASSQNQTALANAAARNQAGQFGASARNNASQFNATQGNQMNQFNAGAINQGEQARFNNLMQGAQTFSGLADQGFGFGQDITRQQMAQGALTRQMNQQLIDAGRQQYGNYTNTGNLGLSPLAQFASGNYGETITESSNPGLLGTIGAGVQLASAFCWVAREVYGQSNPEWLDFREWMLTKAPAWLRKAYIKHGPKWAEWVKRNPWSKRVLRPVMDWLKG